MPGKAGKGHVLLGVESVQDKLQDRIVYGEYQIKYLEDEIIKEQRYRQRVQREKKHNQTKMLIYTALAGFLGAALLFLSLWETYFSRKSAEVLYPISLIVLLPIMVIMALVVAVSAVKMVQYARRLRGDVDWKTFKYMSYAKMKEDSFAREQHLHEELLRTQVTYQSDQELLAERTKNIVPQEMKIISRDELKQIHDESQMLPDETVDVRKMGYIPKE